LGEIRGHCETVERARVLAGDVFRASFGLERSTGQRQSAKLLGIEFSHRSTNLNTRARKLSRINTRLVVFSPRSKRKRLSERRENVVGVSVSRKSLRLARRTRERETSSRGKFLAPPFVFLARYEEKEEASGKDDHQNDNDAFASTSPSRLSLRARV